MKVYLVFDTESQKTICINLASRQLYHAEINSASKSKNLETVSKGILKQVQDDKYYVMLNSR